jgi:hypothetical protein
MFLACNAYLPIWKFEHDVVLLDVMLCIGSCFELALFRGPCNHVSCSLPHFMIFDVVTRTRATMFSISPLKVVRVHR